MKKYQKKKSRKYLGGTTPNPEVTKSVIQAAPVSPRYRGQAPSSQSGSVHNRVTQFNQRQAKISAHSGGSLTPLERRNFQNITVAYPQSSHHHTNQALTKVTANNLNATQKSTSEVPQGCPPDGPAGDNCVKPGVRCCTTNVSAAETPQGKALNGGSKKYKKSRKSRKSRKTRKRRRKCKRLRKTRR